MEKMRYQWMDVCGECGECEDHQRCADARKKLRPYIGIRPTSDGFDCALPIAIDSHSVCAYGCLYCFAENLVTHRGGRTKPIGQTPLRAIERLFSGSDGKKYNIWQEALKYDRRNEGGYPTPVQLGAICEPGDHIERQQGWLIEFCRLAIKYNQPVRISTKGTVFALKDYLEVFSEAPHLFWVAFSIISPDDKLLQKVDRRAPNATERLKAMAALSKIGVKTALRFRPLFPGLSDSTPRYPHAYRTLIEKAADAGASAISYEVGFVPGLQTAETRWRWDEMSRILNVPFTELYKKFGPTMACMRPPPVWTENIMHAIRDEAHDNDMDVGVSDPVWKQLTDTGCCCGIMPDDPVFGNWQEESATNQLLIAKNTGKLIGPNDIIPDWAWKLQIADIINPGVGPKIAYKLRHHTWGDQLHTTWNKTGHQRSPLNYFQGALMPDHVDEDGDVFYKYIGLKRSYPKKMRYWKVD